MTGSDVRSLVQRIRRLEQTVRRSATRSAAPDREPGAVVAKRRQAAGVDDMLNADVRQALAAAGTDRPYGLRPSWQPPGPGASGPTASIASIIARQETAARQVQVPR